MKNIYSIILFVLLPLFSFGQKHQYSELPKLLDGKRLCLDPGHGGHDGDDREIYLGYGLTFWESDGNFAQANFAAEILENLGANVKVTRYTNDSHDANRQPSLSERVAIGNAFDADFFHSIHTNSGSGVANYTSVFQHENNSSFTSDQTKMSQIMNDVIFNVVYTQGKYNKTANFGVLRGNNQPAVLTEACMHDYVREGRRLNSTLYKKAMAYSYVRGYLKFYDAGVFPYGEIEGRVFYKYGYKASGFEPNNYDHGEEVNFAKITLSRNGTVLETQYTDKGYDGYFFFDMLEEGSYNLKIEKEGMPTQTKTVEVVKGSVSKNDIIFDQEPVEVVSYAPELVYVGQAENGGNGVFAKWRKSKIEGLVGYRLLWSSDLTTWKVAADETTLTASLPLTRTLVTINLENQSDFKDVPSTEAKFFKVVAVGSSVSDDSDIYLKTKLSGTKKILVVDAYQSKSGNIQVDESIVKGYYNSLSKIASVGTINTLNTARIWESYIELNDYDVIVWIVANEKSENENFSLKETLAVQEYLKQGGKIIVSGSDIGYDMILNGKRHSEQNFYTDYLKAKCSSDFSGTTGKGIGVAGTYLEGMNLTFESDAFNFNPDVITPWGGSEVILKDENDNDLAVAYTGVFSDSPVVGRMTYFAFPLELLSQSQLDEVISKTFVYFDKYVQAPPPDKPGVTELLSVSLNKDGDGVDVRWAKSTSKYIGGYNVYYAEKSNPDVWKSVVNYEKVDANATKVDIKFSDFEVIPTETSSLSFKVEAVAYNNDQAVVGDLSEQLSYYKGSGYIDVLVVDAFDRKISGFDYSVNLQTLDSEILIKNKSVRSVSTCTNEAVSKTEGVDLSDYNTVVWISGEESTNDETFSNEEQANVKTYLENGGSLFVSGAEIGWDLSSKGKPSDKEFYTNYLKAKFESDGKKEYSSANGVYGTMFSDVTFDFSKLWKVNYPDAISVEGGSESIFTYTAGIDAGVYYKGTFGSSSVEGAVIYLGFPIETADVSDIEIVFGKSLNYFRSLVKNTPPIAEDDNAVATSGNTLEIDVLGNDTDSDGDMDDTSITIIDSPKNGSIVLDYGKVYYTSNTDFVGTDSFTYTVADAKARVSEKAMVTVEVNKGDGLPYELEVDPNHPKRDMRAVFISTVSNLDWPFSSHNDADKQMYNFKAILDKFEDANVNTVMFQVRPAADVLYKSTIEPWSKVLTATQGKDPGYDPLEFAIEQSHLRGMELHAWVNPYRTLAGTSSTVGSGNPSAMHIENKHPEWILISGQGRHILNPGIPEVIDYVVSVVDELARNYDVDGIHFDDYFYFYEGTPDALDNAEYNLYNPDGLNKGDWRRANVDKLLKAVNNKIQEINVAQNKNIIFGVSPFGIWRNGVPAGISGMDAYSAIFADPLSWLDKGYVDYLAPQLYWEIGGRQDYDKLASWWDDKVAEKGRYSMPSQGLYQMNGKGWAPQEIINQIAINREDKNNNTLGQIFFRALNLARNEKRIINELTKSTFKYPSVPASYVWKEGVMPNKPESLVYEGGKLSWTLPSPAVDADTARKYIVYRFNSMEELITDKHNGRRIVAITGEGSIVVPDSWLNYGENYICVSALDKNNNESELSNVVVIDSRPTYCDAKGLDASSEWIQQVRFHSAVNTSGNDNGYHDYTNKIFNLKLGADIEMELTPGFSGSAFAEHWKVYIDFNNDGDFKDNDENIFATNSSSNTAVSQIISLPENVDEGVFRMRVVMKGTSSSNDIDACTDVAKGEVEDYLVNISVKYLATDDFDKEQSIGVAFPNPFNTELQFTMNTDRNEDVELVVYNYMGQIVHQNTHAVRKGENTISINSSQWSNGVYLMLVRTESGRKSIYEVVKN